MESEPKFPPEETVSLTTLSEAVSFFHCPERRQHRKCSISCLSACRYGEQKLPLNCYQEQFFFITQPNALWIFFTSVHLNCSYTLVYRSLLTALNRWAKTGPGRERGICQQTVQPSPPL
ncbi:hypothetical protein CHARACLAT_025690 [Characodon lateralis]|uniref:Uncharacterized protein n=1 Tax=Characodon lateralis TaxID=208331 RepID=A0ABU7EQL1_9TELE|nr:hypothetical protein [Characodon lateralis]